MAAVSWVKICGRLAAWSVTWKRPLPNSAICCSQGVSGPRPMLTIETVTPWDVNSPMSSGTPSFCSASEPSARTMMWRTSLVLLSSASAAACSPL